MARYPEQKDARTFRPGCHQCGRPARYIGWTMSRPDLWEGACEVHCAHLGERFDVPAEGLTLWLYRFTEGGETWSFAAVDVHQALVLFEEHLVNVHGFDEEEIAKARHEAVKTIRALTRPEAESIPFQHEAPGWELVTNVWGAFERASVPCLVSSSLR